MSLPKGASQTLRDMGGLPHCHHCRLLPLLPGDGVSAPLVPGGSLVQPSREAVGAPSAQRRILKQAPRTGCVVPATAHGLSHGALSRALRPSPALPALQFARSLHPKPAVTLVR